MKSLETKNCQDTEYQGNRIVDCRDPIDYFEVGTVNEKKNPAQITRYLIHPQSDRHECDKQSHSGMTHDHEDVKPTRVVTDDQESHPLDQLGNWSSRCQLSFCRRIEQVAEIFTNSHIVAECLFVVPLERMISDFVEVYE